MAKKKMALNPESGVSHRKSAKPTVQKVVRESEPATSHARSGLEFDQTRLDREHDMFDSGWTDRIQRLEDGLKETKAALELLNQQRSPSRESSTPFVPGAVPQS